MKKILSLLLTLVMVFGLVGCMPSIFSKQEPLSRGTIEGDVYKNEVLKFEFTKPSSWVYSSDEEIAKTMNMTVENFLGDKFKEALENNPTVFDMMVVDRLTGTNIAVSYENLKKTHASNITIEKYIEALKEQTAELTVMTVSFNDKIEKVKLGEKEFTRCVSMVVANGTRMSQAYYLRKVNGYMAIVVITATSKYTVSEIEEMFK